MRHEIIVGGMTGLVHESNDAIGTTKVYSQHIRRSRSASDEIAGKTITWLKDGVVFKMYLGRDDGGCR